jgi:hypothetical protein
MARWRTIITAASGITVAIGTFVASGHSPLYTNEGLRISMTYDRSARTLNVSRKGPNLNCWIRLRTPSPAYSAVARLPNGQRLDVRFGKPDSRWLFISQVPKKEETWPKQFTWTSGVVIAVEQLPEPDEWDVYPDQGSPDSSADVRRRTGLVSFAVIGLFAAVASAVAGAFPDEQKKPTPSVSLSAQAVIDALMSEVQGSEEGETAIMHRYVRNAVLIGAKPAQELMKPGNEKRLALDADTVFRKRFGDLLENLNAIGKIFLE